MGTTSMPSPRSSSSIVLDPPSAPAETAHLPRRRPDPVIALSGDLEGLRLHAGREERLRDRVVEVAREARPLLLRGALRLALPQGLLGELTLGDDPCGMPNPPRSSPPSSCSRNALSRTHLT